MTQRSCATEYTGHYNAVAPFDNRIGIMGGTFDPVHNGHIKMGMDAHDEFGLSKVLYIPTGRPPHKAKSEVTNNEHRMTMLELAVDQPYMQPSRIEIDRRGTTYAVDTLSLLKRIFKEHVFYYIIGSDTLFNLHSWKNISQVLTMTHFIVFLREDDNAQKVNEMIDFYNASGIMRFFLAREPGLPISSTDIRLRLLNGSDLSGLLPEKVSEYIKENNLYIK
ncbi:MAG: nicotinate-nucleotide adenylyltransferase [Eubacteriales bacterium]